MPERKWQPNFIENGMLGILKNEGWKSRGVGIIWKAEFERIFTKWDLEKSFKKTEDEKNGKWLKVAMQKCLSGGVDWSMN